MTNGPDQIRSASLSPPPSTSAQGLAQLTNISHGFFGRQGGTSKGLYDSLNAGAGSDDDPAAIAANRARIAEAIGAESSAHLLSCHQHHSADALLVEAPFSGRPKGDAMVTRTPGLALAILTADCVPVLFADREAGVIGAAHSGWKGAMGGICDATLEAMEAIGAKTDRIIAAIGPAIGQASYEVGPEFQDRFLAHRKSSDRFFRPSKGDRLLFDIQGFVHNSLTRAGVSQVDVIARDTCALDEHYFSNRRRNHQGLPDYGRNASVIMLKP
ncbi:MAG: peptidoglycan editing factor PgeF [Pseudomonadota bacterium]